MDLKAHREKLVKQHDDINARITEYVTIRERTLGAIAMIDEQLKEAGPQPVNRAERRRKAKEQRA